MQLPDEAIEFNYQNAVLPSGEAWTPLAELQAKNLLSRARIQLLLPTINMVRGQVVSEREVEQKPGQPSLDPGFIDLPFKLLEAHRKRGEQSELGRIQALAARLRDEVDRVIVLGIGGSYMGARALFEALLPTYHNELPPPTRMGKPRIHFEGNGVDNDAFQELLDMLEVNCIDPDKKEERWGAIVISKSGETLETAVAFRLFRNEAANFYGANSPRRKQLIIPITGDRG